MSDQPGGQLAVSIDGKPLEAAAAKELWRRFSSHMDLHRGDFDGFATSEGYATAHVAVVGGQPTLTLSSTLQPAGAVASGPRNRIDGRRSQYLENCQVFLFDQHHHL